MKNIKLFLKIFFNFFSFTFIKQFFDLLSEFIIENVAEIRRIHKGKNVNISASARFFYGNNIYIDDNTNINRFCILWASKNSKIFIGKNCLTGPGVIILTSKYKVGNRKLIRSQKELELDVIIEDDVWLGANVVILPGVKIGEGAIIGSGVIVSKNVDSYKVIISCQNKLLKDRI